MRSLDEINPSALRMAKTLWSFGHSECNWVNSLTTKELMAKFSSANFQKLLSPRYIILRLQRLEGKQCRSR